MQQAENCDDSPHLETHFSSSKYDEGHSPIPARSDALYRPDPEGFQIKQSHLLQRISNAQLPRE